MPLLRRPAAARGAPVAHDGRAPAHLLSGPSTRVALLGAAAARQAPRRAAAPGRARGPAPSSVRPSAPTQCTASRDGAATVALCAFSTVHASCSRLPARPGARSALKPAAPWPRQHPAGGLAVCEGQQQAALLLQLTQGASDSLRVAAYAPQGARSVGESSARMPPGFPPLSRLFTDAAGSRPYGTLTHGSNKLLVVGEDALMSNTGALSLASFCARSGSVMQVQLGVCQHVCQHDDTPLSAAAYRHSPCVVRQEKVPTRPQQAGTHRQVRLGQPWSGSSDSCRL